MRGRDGNYRTTGLLIERDRAKLHQQLHAAETAHQVETLNQESELVEVPPSVVTPHVWAKWIVTM